MQWADPQLQGQLLGYIGLIVALLVGLVGVLIIGRLFRDWRRLNERARNQPPPPPPVDPWAASAQRLKDSNDDADAESPDHEPPPKD